MGRRSEAAELYRDLHDRNPECWDYYKKLDECLQSGALEKNLAGARRAVAPVNSAVFSGEHHPANIDLYHSVVTAVGR